MEMDSVLQKYLSIIQFRVFNINDIDQSSTIRMEDDEYYSNY